MNLFKEATKNHWKFETAKGVLGVEDLWDLPLEGEVSLDAIAVSIWEKMEKEKKSFIRKSSSDANELLQNKLELIKEIIADKLEEKERKAKEAEKAAKKQMILEILQKKETEDLLQKDTAELRKMLEEL